MNIITILYITLNNFTLSDAKYTYFFNSFFPIMTFSIFGLIVGCIICGLPYFMSLRKDKNKEDISEYECGFEPFDSATRQPFTIHYYLVGLLFLIFDTEVCLLFPWCAHFDQLTWSSYGALLFFFYILLIGYVYEWKIQAMELSPVIINKVSIKKNIVFPCFILITPKSWVTFLSDGFYFCLFTCFFLIVYYAWSYFIIKPEMEKREERKQLRLEWEKELQIKKSQNKTTEESIIAKEPIKENVQITGGEVSKKEEKTDCKKNYPAYFVAGWLFLGAPDHFCALMYIFYYYISELSTIVGLYDEYRSDYYKQKIEMYQRFLTKEYYIMTYLIYYDKLYKEHRIKQIKKKIHRIKKNKKKNIMIFDSYLFYKFFFAFASYWEAFIVHNLTYILLFIMLILVLCNVYFNMLMPLFRSIIRCKHFAHACIIVSKKKTSTFIWFLIINFLPFWIFFLTLIIINLKNIFYNYSVYLTLLKLSSFIIWCFIFFIIYKICKWIKNLKNQLEILYILYFVPFLILCLFCSFFILNRLLKYYILHYSYFTIYYYWTYKIFFLTVLFLFLISNKKTLYYSIIYMFLLFYKLLRLIRFNLIRWTGFWVRHFCWTIIAFSVPACLLVTNIPVIFACLNVYNNITVYGELWDKVSCYVILFVTALLCIIVYIYTFVFCVLVYSNYWDTKLKIRNINSNFCIRLSFTEFFHGYIYLNIIALILIVCYFYCDLYLPTAIFIIHKSPFIILSLFVFICPALICIIVIGPLNVFIVKKNLMPKIRIIIYTLIKYVYKWFLKIKIIKQNITKLIFYASTYSKKKVVKLYTKYLLIIFNSHREPEGAFFDNLWEDFIIYGSEMLNYLNAYLYVLWIPSIFIIVYFSKKILNFFYVYVKFFLTFSILILKKRIRVVYFLCLTNKDFNKFVYTAIDKCYKTYIISRLKKVRKYLFTILHQSEMKLYIPIVNYFVYSIITYIRYTPWFWQAAERQYALVRHFTFTFNTLPMLINKTLFLKIKKILLNIFWKWSVLEKVPFIIFPLYNIKKEALIYAKGVDFHLIDGFERFIMDNTSLETEKQIENDEYRKNILLKRDGKNRWEGNNDEWYTDMYCSTAKDNRESIIAEFNDEQDWNPTLKYKESKYGFVLWDREETMDDYFVNMADFLIDYEADTCSFIEECEEIDFLEDSKSTYETLFISPIAEIVFLHWKNPNIFLINERENEKNVATYKKEKKNIYEKLPIYDYATVIKKKLNFLWTKQYVTTNLNVNYWMLHCAKQNLIKKNRIEYNVFFLNIESFKLSRPYFIPNIVLEPDGPECDYFDDSFTATFLDPYEELERDSPGILSQLSQAEKEEMIDDRVRQNKALDSFLDDADIEQLTDFYVEDAEGGAHFFLSRNSVANTYKWCTTIWEKSVEFKFPALVISYEDEEEVIPLLMTKIELFEQAAEKQIHLKSIDRYDGSIVLLATIHSIYLMFFFVFVIIILIFVNAVKKNFFFNQNKQLKKNNVFYFILIFNVFYIFINIFLLLIQMIFLLIAIAYYTLAERKIMGYMQRRLGPNIEGGAIGILQPLADGLKAFIKELILPSHANNFIFLCAPLCIFILNFAAWATIPFFLVLNWNCIIYDTINVLQYNWLSADLNYGIIFLLAISSLNVYGIILGGWASNSKYAFLGALRSAAQMISYEVSIGLTILPTVLLAGSFSLFRIMLIQHKTIWFVYPLLPCALIFYVSMLAETNRAPFDLPEAEAELVAGYNVEYSSMSFALFFLSEYSNMLLMSSFFMILFFGGFFFCSMVSFFILSLKISISAYSYIWVRATYPRLRYDQLMYLGWKTILPIVVSLFFLTLSLLTFSKSIPLTILIK